MSHTYPSSESTKTRRTREEEMRRLKELAYQAGDVDHYAGKRSDTRCKAGMLLELTTDPNDSAATFSATMRDIGGNGIGFLTKHELPVRSIIWVREFTEHGDAPWLKTRVVHIEQSVASFSVGVELS